MYVKERHNIMSILTKVFLPNHLATPNINKFYSLHNDTMNPIDRIQDNMDGYLLVTYKKSSPRLYNYHLNKWYSHDKIQINFNGWKIIKQIDSFDQNNLIIGNQLRNWVLNKIKRINNIEDKITSMLGIGGEYYLYWVGLTNLNINKLVGISNHKSIVEDAQFNVPWSTNYFIDYNDLKKYPKIISTDLILINLFQINVNLIKYVNKIKFKKIILIACNLPDTKLKLLVEYFKLVEIKYFMNFDNYLRVITMIKKT